MTTSETRRSVTSRKPEGAGARRLLRKAIDDSTRYEAVLDAAVRAATIGGFDGVQMRSVARAANIAVGTLYQHFPSKTHLLIAVLGREFERIAAECDWSISGGTLLHRLAMLTSRLHAEWQRDPRLTEATTRALVGADTAAAAAVTQTAGVVQQLFACALGAANITERHREVAVLISDVWLANLCAVSSRRIRAAQARERIDRGVGLLVRRLDIS